MKRQHVKSTVILSIGYDPETRELEARFINKEIYRYFNVPSEEYEALMKADSIGEYFNKIFKSKNYKYTKVEEG